MPEPTTTPVALRAQREQTIRVLCDHFAADRLEVTEFEHRLDLANRAATPAELDALTADLVPTPAAPVPAPATRARAPARAPAQGGRQLIAGIMGGATRRGRWTPAAETTAIGIMGGVMLDFRDALLSPGETVIHAFAFWGGVSIVVPPDLEVAVNGVGIMGGFDHRGQVPANASPDAPRLRIDGVAIMGGVDVQVRAAGEPAGWDGPNPRIGPQQAWEDRREVRRSLREERRLRRGEGRGRR